MNLINNKWETVIGLEIHAQVTTKSKLFSSAANCFLAEPNSCVALFDAAIPGALPVLNSEAIVKAVKTGVAINGTINKHSAFDRKHYFYQDLPSGYQISQFYFPIVSDGKIEIDLSDGSKKTINIERIHLEQDAGKSIHEQGSRYTYVDLNRAGVPLMEIVSKPDIRSSTEAIQYIKKLQLLMQYVGSCDGNMERGNLRCDVNISIRPSGCETLGTRCEIKNLNSTSNIEDAIHYEVSRQIDILESGGTIQQQTRLFDADKCETRTLRSKEESVDYRYFADPDLCPIDLTDEFIENIRSSMPILPDEKRGKYNSLGINSEFIKSMMNDFEAGLYFDEILKMDPSLDINLVANWVNVELLSRLNKAGVFCFSESVIKASALCELLKSIQNELINGKIAKDVLDRMFDSCGERSADEIIKTEGLAQITDDSSVEKAIDEVLSMSKKQIDDYLCGKEALFGYFIGQTMKLGKGKFNPEVVNRILKEKLHLLK